MLTRTEVGALSVSAALVAWALWTSATIERQVAAEIGRLRSHSAARWSALVETGIRSDSATVLVLADLRHQIAGQASAIPALAFVPAVDLERLWQARLLNPFIESGTTAPRNDAERRTLQAEQNDVRLALQVGRPLVKATRDARARLVLALCMTIALSATGVIAHRARGRRRDLPAAASR